MHVALHDCDSRRVLISWPVQLCLGSFFHDRRCQTGVTETGASAHFDRNPHGFGDRFSFVSRIEHSAHVGVDAKRTTCIVRAGDGDEFLECREEFYRMVHDIAEAMGGSFSAEHGIGTLKREDLKRYKTGPELDLMKALKAALDPKGIMNPGKVL